MTQAEERAADWARERVGQGYIWGATGWVCSRARREAQAKQYPAQAEMILGVGAKWDGKVCWDCATFVRGAAKAGGIRLCSGATSQWRKTAWADKRTIDSLPTGRVVMLYRQSGNTMQHTGISLGDGECVHAKGTKYGVITQGISSYPWTHWAIPAWDDEKEGAEMDEQMVVVADSGSTVRMRATADAGGAVVCAIPIGAVVTRSGTEGDWSRISYGGQDGYMMTRFLKAAEANVTRAEFDALAQRVAALEGRT